MAIDCTDDVALRTSICNINTDLEQMITNADGVLTTNYGAKPIKQLVREGINNDLQALGINYVWATATERAAQTGMVLDDQGYQIDTKEVYKYNGTSWIFYYSLGATEFSDNTFKIVDGARSATTGASFQFSADSIATGSNITITVPNIDLIMGDARRDLSIAHDITTDANYTLTATQNQYGRIEITDTGVILTGAINIIMNNDEHTFLFVNSTSQSLTVKTSVGTGISVPSGTAKQLRNDTVDVIQYEEIIPSADTKLANSNKQIVVKSDDTWIANQCTAWVRFAGAAATITASYNVSSITRISAGVYDVFFTVAMSNTNYSINGTSYNNFDYHVSGDISNSTTAKVRVVNYDTTSNTYADEEIAIHVFGGK